MKNMDGTPYLTRFDLPQKIFTQAAVGAHEKLNIPDPTPFDPDRPINFGAPHPMTETSRIKFTFFCLQVDLFT
jgi:hypothetical protein